jgi:hypothetical protein
LNSALNLLDLDVCAQDTVPPGDARVLFQQMVTNVDYSGDKVGR